MITSAQPAFSVRPATAADAAVLARHCVEMYGEMGVLPADCRGALLTEAAAFIAPALERGEYRAWVATPADRPEVVIAGAALHLRPGLPRLRRRGEHVEVTSGPQGLVCHVYTEPPWRRRGVARTLLEALLSWTAAEDVPHVFLHASEEGRALYELLGFVPTNEMRYAGGRRPAP